MIVVGGTYLEHVTEPAIHKLQGSGLRAVSAISRAVAPIRLVTLVSEEDEASAGAIADSLGFEIVVTRRSDSIAFRYETPLSRPNVIPIPTVQQMIAVDDDVVLAFGMVDAAITVHAGSAIVDPQNPGYGFLDDRVSVDADRLAIVANRREVLSGTTKGTNLLESAQALRRSQGAEVVIVKCGAMGVIVVEDSRQEVIGARPTKSVVGLGTGDVFSAVFAYQWGHMKNDPVESARAASAATAGWVSDPIPQVISPSGIPLISSVSDELDPKPVTVYIAGPFFTLPERWLIQLVEDATEGLGGENFSPLRDVGEGPPDEVAPRDLAGLDSSDVLLALLDGADAGTMVEVGYAIANEIPVVGYSSVPNDSDYTMVAGMGIEIFDDLTSAVYNTLWTGMRH